MIGFGLFASLATGLLALSLLTSGLFTKWKQMSLQETYCSTSLSTYLLGSSTDCIPMRLDHSAPQLELGEAPPALCYFVLQSEELRSIRLAPRTSSGFGRKTVCNFL